MLPVKYSPKAEKYFKKLKDKQLKKNYENAINRIRLNPDIGDKKTGDLAGLYAYNLYYSGTNYEIAYTVEIIARQTVVIILAGTRENFYEELKKYIFSR